MKKEIQIKKRQKRKTWQKQEVWFYLAHFCLLANKRVRRSITVLCPTYMPNA